jgi:hypothetical protein
VRSDADEPPEHDAAGALYESGESWVRFSDGVAPVPTIVRVAGEPGVGFRVEGAGSERLNGDYVRDPAGFPHEFKFRKAGGGSEYCYLSGGAWFLMADGVGSSWRASTTTLPPPLPHPSRRACCSPTGTAVRTPRGVPTRCRPRLAGW